MEASKNSYHIVLEKQDEGGYTVYVPELPGCISQGETEKGALENIQEAIDLYISEMRISNLERLLSRIKIIEPAPSVSV
ncbi:TPA: type II toxin-antitoxin system HicB family antitoxin [Candidatus Micrarchaeota archaeon]|nr:type II toxin-antitoxin system HicB family antitoxin [Candidatus Micrarchaeota archaeon]